jgi:acetamidase/formamidase
MLNRLAVFLCFAPVLVLAQGPLAGDWLLTTDLYGNLLHQRMTMDEFGNALEYSGKINGDTMSGNVIRIDSFDAANRTTTTFTARMLPSRPPGPPRRLEFTPTIFYRQFSPYNKPVLTVWPGDTIHTTTLDATGTDEQSVTRTLGGNPQTGPFYVETAMPGDTLAVHFNRVRLNRDWAFSDDAIIGRALRPGQPEAGQAVRWKLDRERGLAVPEKPSERLKNYSVPLRPMMGCVAVAPGFASAPPAANDSGSFGGNIDFNGVVEGTTVYLPVSQPGALLYVGDGHAVQGDGELTGNALETSMDVEFTVDVIPGKRIFMPRVESPTHIMVIGLAGSLDEALREATANLSQWLKQDYQFTDSDIGQVLGTAVEFQVNEIADRNVGVVAKLNKQRLATILPSTNR